MTAARPVIALTTSEIRSPARDEQVPHADAGRRELALGLTYMRALSAAGAAPVVLAPLEPDAIPELLDAVSGLCIPGGPDIDPAAYGQPRNPHLGPTDSALDRFELAAIREAVRREMPLLAICRGIQALNVALGGDLHQHLPGEPGGPVRHQREKVEEPGLEHKVRIEPRSLLAEALGVARAVVNSYHHQGLRRLGAGLRPVAWADDGLVEGVERAGSTFTVGVQWHAEAMDDSAEQAALFRAFVDSARAYAASTSSTARTAAASQG